MSTAAFCEFVFQYVDAHEVSSKYLTDLLLVSSK